MTDKLLLATFQSHFTRNLSRFSLYSGDFSRTFRFSNLLVCLEIAHEFFNYFELIYTKKLFYETVQMWTCSRLLLSATVRVLSFQQPPPGRKAGKFFLTSHCL